MVRRCEGLSMGYLVKKREFLIVSISSQFDLERGTEVLHGYNARNLPQNGAFM